MGDHEGVVQPNGPLPNGLLPNVAANVMRKLDHDRWLIAEERTAELIACIQPNKPSEERRNAVADYVQRLIMKCFPCQVFTFGSVPLKTYLPDGDIDLTAFSKDQNLRDSWANDVREILELEEKREDAEFHVKEVQYIQAEVKIIKCLVENIVVDISFNQLGGLCTLCFLEEVDHLINQNHLFKRSIILIKAWCYYESRILGAHHGLISTYGLETLVLYIFHVFNNSFTGPLEVLYRFLEFFSNFDWGNFCVSLWGPVPISQLPEITAITPRKDAGKLLLSKPFLDACGSVYAVCPGMQENQGQPFVSKHFNVIDPLRTNNNLGRSVSKGNFFRIRSAFAFGAKKLVRLLDCPKENLIGEVNQFFMNTWERHDSRQRPDAPNSDLMHFQPPKLEPTRRSDNLRNQLTKRKDHEAFIEVSRASSSGGSSTIPSASTGCAPMVGRTSGIHHSFSQENYSNQHINADEFPYRLKVDPSSNGQEVLAKHQFSRTRSSPELSDTSNGPSLKGKRTNKASEIRKEHLVTTRPDHINRRKNTSSETSASHMSLSTSIDPSTLGHSSSQKNLDSCAPTNLASPVKSYVHDDGNVAQQDLQQEEQDLVNMMAATRAHGFPGPMNFGSSHIPVSLQPLLLQYSQRNLGGLMPANLPFVDPAWVSGMQFPPGIVSSQLVHYFSGLGLASSQEIIHSSNENSALTEPNQDHNDAVCWSENDNTFASGSNFTSSHAGDSGTATRSQQRNFQNRRGINYTPEKSANMRSSRNEGNVSEPTRSSRDKRIANAGGGFPTTHDKSKTSCQSERDASALEDEVDNKDWRLSSSRSASSSSGVHSGLPVGYEAGTGGSEPMIPGPMLVGSGSQQVTFYPTGPPVPFVTMLPIYNFPPDVRNPSGSPREFNRDEGSLENGHINVSEHGTTTSSFAASENLDPSEFFGQSSVKVTTSESRVEPNADILNSDFTSHWQNLQYGRICQGPRNYPPLIYSPQFVVPPFYLQGHFPLEGPGRPLSATNMGIISQIMSCGPRLLPIAPLQSSSGRPTRVYQRYGEELPRYRSGTGTYLPNPKPIQLRDRQSANNRSNRSSYNYDRNEPGDNDRAWNQNSKARGSGRSHNKYDSRSHADKLGSRSDRPVDSDNRASRSWDSYRHDNINSLPTQSGSLTPTSSVHGTNNLAYGVYPLQAVNSNGAVSSLGEAGPGVPSVVMLYTYEQGVGYTQAQDQLEFGSLGPVQFSSSNDASQVEGSTPQLYEQHGLFMSGSPSRSSPD